MPLISDKQREANRRNAQNSTGPNTEAGKAKSRLNSTTHGLTAKATTINRRLRNEDPDDFLHLRASLIQDWNPQGTAELLEIERMANAYKRIQRAEAMESSFFDGALEAMELRLGQPHNACDADHFGNAILLGRNEHQLNWENMDRYRRNAWRDYNKSVDQLRKLQADRTKAHKGATETRASKPASALPAISWASFMPPTPAQPEAPARTPQTTTEPPNQPPNKTQNPEEPPKAA